MPYKITDFLIDHKNRQIVRGKNHSAHWGVVHKLRGFIGVVVRWGCIFMLLYDLYEELNHYHIIALSQNCSNDFFSLNYSHRIIKQLSRNMRLHYFRIKYIFDGIFDLHWCDIYFHICHKLFLLSSIYDRELTYIVIFSE